MHKLDEVFKSIDSKLLENTDFQKALTEAVDSLVLEKAETKAQELFESKEAEYTKALDEQLDVLVKTIEAEQQEKFNEAVADKVKTITEAYGAEVKVEAEAKLEEEVKTLKEQVQMYVNHAINEFVQEAEPAWVEEVHVLKANKIMESFVNLSESFGIDMLKLTGSNSDKITEMNESLDKAIHRSTELEKQINEMKKEKLLDEARKNLTAPQVDRFNSLMESVDYISESDFTSKIELYKSAIVDSGNSYKSQKIQESKPSERKLSWK